MTPTEIMTTALTRAGAPSTTATAIVDQARTYLNMQLGELWAFAPWSWRYKTATFNTVASTKTYSLATDVETYSGFYDETNDTILLPLAPSQMLRADPDQSEEGMPDWYAHQGRDSSGDIQVDLHPTPDDAYTLRYEYRRRLPVLTSGDDGTTIDDEVPRGPAQSGLVFGVAALYMQEQGDLESAAVELALRTDNWNQAKRANRPLADERLTLGPPGVIQPYLNVDTRSVISAP